MLIPVRRTLSVMTAVTAALVLSSVARMPSSVAKSPGRSATTHVLHRVVWVDAARGVKGIHLHSAKVDGSAAHRIYNSRKGFVTSLNLDRQGRRVAFAPVSLRARVPLLVAVPVRGGKVWKPLAHRPRFYFVGGIGWSPSGRRLVFEGSTDDGTHVHSALWTVRLNGTGLRRVLKLPPPTSAQGLFINDALAWTRSGILYSDGRNLRVARKGDSHLVLRHVVSFRISGNGHHLVTWREGRKSRLSLWDGKPNGTDQHRLYTTPKPNAGGPTYDFITPNYDGSRVLASRSVLGDRSDLDVVWWHPADDPDTATTIPKPGANWPVTWN